MPEAQWPLLLRNAQGLAEETDPHVKARLLADRVGLLARHGFASHATALLPEARTPCSSSMTLRRSSGWQSPRRSPSYYSPDRARRSLETFDTALEAAREHRMPELAAEAATWAASYRDPGHRRVRRDRSHPVRPSSMQARLRNHAAAGSLPGRQLFRRRRPARRCTTVPSRCHAPGAPCRRPAALQRDCHLPAADRTQRRARSARHGLPVGGRRQPLGAAASGGGEPKFLWRKASADSPAPRRGAAPSWTLRGGGQAAGPLSAEGEVEGMGEVELLVSRSDRAVCLLHLNDARPASQARNELHSALAGRCRTTPAPRC